MNFSPARPASIHLRKMRSHPDNLEFIAIGGYTLVAQKLSSLASRDINFLFLYGIEYHLLQSPLEKGIKRKNLV